MNRYLVIALTLSLAGCGVETLGTAATVGAARNQEAQDAKKNQEQFQQRLNATMQEAEKQRQEAERRAGL